MILLEAIGLSHYESLSAMHEVELECGAQEGA
jgi:hypothetical protein